MSTFRRVGLGLRPLIPKGFRLMYSATSEMVELIKDEELVTPEADDGRDFPVSSRGYARWLPTGFRHSASRLSISRTANRRLPPPREDGDSHTRGRLPAGSRSNGHSKKPADARCQAQTL